MKKINSIVFLLMGVIIVILAVLCVLFATDKITINNNSTNKNSSNSNETPADNKESESYSISYEEEVYTTKNIDNVENSRSTRNIVSIKNERNQNAASAIASKLNAISNQQWASIKEAANDTVELSYTGLGVNYLFKTGEVTNNRLTFIANLEGNFGGVQWSGIEGYNFDASNGNLLKLEDIGSEAYNYIYNKSIDSIENNKNDYSCVVEDWKDKVKENLNQEGSWYFTSTGIKIIFNKYSIACGANGVTTIDITATDINPYLDAKYKFN